MIARKRPSSGQVGWSSASPDRFLCLFWLSLYEVELHSVRAWDKTWIGPGVYKTYNVVYAGWTGSDVGSTTLNVVDAGWTGSDVGYTTINVVNAGCGGSV